MGKTTQALTKEDRINRALITFQKELSAIVTEAPKEEEEWITTRELADELPNFFRTTAHINLLYKRNKKELTRRGAVVKTPSGRYRWHRQKTLDWYFNRPAK